VVTPAETVVFFHRCLAGCVSSGALFSSPSAQAAMKEYKVESRTYYSKMTTDKNHIADSSAEEIQDLLDEYTRDGWTLASTDATSFGFAVYIYLYFERDA
jgi:hypothetical protein